MLVGVDYNNDSAANAAQQTTALLQRSPDLSGIFGANLFSAEGAAQAVKNANLSGVVQVANFDAPEQAISDLRAGTVSARDCEVKLRLGPGPDCHSNNELSAVAGVVQLFVANLPFMPPDRRTQRPYSGAPSVVNVWSAPALWPPAFVAVTRKW